jgi:hypothetical protein
MTCGFASGSDASLRRIDAVSGPLRPAMPSCSISSADEAVMVLRSTMLVRLAATRVPPWTARVFAIVVAAGGVLGAPTGSLAAAAPEFTPGARSLGDSLFPTIGNGGYDVRHYDLDLDYAVASKRLEGTATIDAVATQGLSRFTFDLTAWNVVRRVTIDGRPATFAGFVPSCVTEASSGRSRGRPA